MSYPAYRCLGCGGIFSVNNNTDTLVIHDCLGTRKNVQSCAEFIGYVNFKPVSVPYSVIRVMDKVFLVFSWVTIPVENFNPLATFLSGNKKEIFCFLCEEDQLIYALKDPRSGGVVRVMLKSGAVVEFCNGVPKGFGFDDMETMDFFKELKG